MNRLAAVVVLAVLTACGGGGSSPDEDGLVTVTLVPTISSGAAAQAFWGGGDDRVEILDIFEGVDRVALLEHELWHILSETHGHPNPLPCASYTNVLDNDLPLAGPCPEEVAQVAAVGKTFRLYFAEDTGSAVLAAHFWNTALGYVAVKVTAVP